MVFSSATFLVIFLPLTMVLYYLIGVLITKSTAVKNLILLIASLIFYAWGEPVYIILMLISIAFNFVIGKDIDQSKRLNMKQKAKTLFICAIVFNIGVLGFFKYSNFLIENIAGITGLGLRPLNLALPVGISFYTFQIMSYIIDLYNGNIRAQRRLLNFALYVSLFPCNECAKAIIQSGIKKVVYESDKYDGTEGNTASKKMLKEAGVELIQLPYSVKVSVESSK